MIYNLPFRRTTLHFAQRRRIEADTFMYLLLVARTPPSQSLDYNRHRFIRPDWILNSTPSISLAHLPLRPRCARNEL